jgi:dienelactone hydrolase
MYDPFARGPFPAGVRSGVATDRERAHRRLPFEVWYPAAPRYGGQDLEPRTQDAFTVAPGTPPLRQAAVRDAAVRPGRYPLVLFSHTSAGHRRQSSFLSTHLASHGYVVGAPDHVGNTAADYAESTRRAAAGEVPPPEEREARLRRLIADRVPDVRFVADVLLAGAAGDVSAQVDGARAGLIGWSFGGWTVLAALEVDPRFGGVVALAPAGNSEPLPGIIPVTLTFAWKRDVPALYLVAEDDAATPLPGQYELFERTPSSKRMFVLRRAGHGHFGDRIDEAGGCPPGSAHLFTRGLALAHLDAALKGDDGARRFLDADPVAALRARGVDALSYRYILPA